MDLPPREHPLAEIQKLVVQLELLEDLLGIRPEPLHTFDPVKRPLRLSSMRYPLDGGVIVETELRSAELPPIPIVNGTTRQLHVLLRNKLLRQPHGFEGLIAVEEDADATELASY